MWQERITQACVVVKNWEGRGYLETWWSKRHSHISPLETNKQTNKQTLGLLRQGHSKNVKPLTPTATTNVKHCLIPSHV